MGNLDRVGSRLQQVSKIAEHAYSMMVAQMFHCFFPGLPLEGLVAIIVVAVLAMFGVAAWLLYM